MGKYDPIDYKPISTEPNTFGRPRQKMWGVFIVNEYTQSNGKQVGVNFKIDDKFKTTSQRVFSVGNTKVRVNLEAEVDFATIDSSITNKPATGPAGEMIYKYTEVLNATAISTGMEWDSGASSNYPAYNAKDVYGNNTSNAKELWYYYEQIYNTKWSLVKLTSNIQEAKSLVNDWLRMPEIDPKSRPYAGISSIMITEIVPADSVIEL